MNDKSIMSKRQLIEDIRRLNATARPQFLIQFDEVALRQYLQHLEDAQAKRVRIAGWVRNVRRVSVTTPVVRVAVPAASISAPETRPSTPNANVSGSDMRVAG